MGGQSPRARVRWFGVDHQQQARRDTAIAVSKKWAADIVHLQEHEFALTATWRLDDGELMSITTVHMPTTWKDSEACATAMEQVTKAQIDICGKFGHHTMVTAGDWNHDPERATDETRQMVWGESLHTMRMEKVFSMGAEDNLWTHRWRHPGGNIMHRQIDAFVCSQGRWSARLALDTGRSDHRPLLLARGPFASRSAPRTRALGVRACAGGARRLGRKRSRLRSP